MMRSRIVVTAFLFTIVACGTRHTVPSGVLKPDKMEVVLRDMMRADQFLADYVFARDSTKNKDKESIAWYSRIFRLHNVTREQFSESFAWYRTHPDFLQPLMDSMSKMNVGAPTQILIDKPVTDSAPTQRIDSGQQTPQVPAQTATPAQTSAPAQTQGQAQPPKPQRADTVRPFFRKERRPAAMGGN